MLLTVFLKFDLFEAEDKLLISIEEVKKLINKGYPCGKPYWMQPYALSTKNFA